MILVDTSIWIDHLRAGNASLGRLLDRGLVLAHPWVIGELVLGHLSRRHDVIAALTGLPEATVATTEEVRTLVDRHQLYGLGIGYVDAQLLAATRLTPEAKLWTGDNRLAAAAARLRCLADPTVTAAAGPWIDRRWGTGSAAGAQRVEGGHVVGGDVEAVHIGVGDDPLPRP